jgi:hypothetical protein
MGIENSMDTVVLQEFPSTSTLHFIKNILQTDYTSQTKFILGQLDRKIEADG